MAKKRKPFYEWEEDNTGRHVRRDSKKEDIGNVYIGGYATIWVNDEAVAEGQFDSIAQAKTWVDIWLKGTFKVKLITQRHKIFE